VRNNSALPEAQAQPIVTAFRRMEPRGLVTNRWTGAAAGIACVVILRLTLYAYYPKLESDFDLLYHAAEHLLRGQNPYPIARQWFAYPLFYPLPAVLLAVPFTLLPIDQARPVFDIMVGSVFAYALWRYRGGFALLALISGSYLFAMRNGQTNPLMVGAGLIPALGFLLVVKPNTGSVIWVSRPSRNAVIGGAVVLALGLLLVPSWPLDWYGALQQQNTHFRPPVFRPGGFLLLLGAIRWRTPEGRLLVATALVPQNVLPHELVTLALIPRNWAEMVIYGVGTWFAILGVSTVWRIPGVTIEMLNAAAWPWIMVAVYLPMLYLVLRRSGSVPIDSVP
jgi:hypothetical protein